MTLKGNSFSRLIQDLEFALATPSWLFRHWTDRMEKALNGVVGALKQQTRSSEENRDEDQLEGPMRSTMCRRARHLRLEKRELLEAASSLHHQTQRLGKSGELGNDSASGEVREKCRLLVNNLRRHHEQDKQLLLQDMMVDVGAGD